MEGEEGKQLSLNYAVFSSDFTQVCLNAYGKALRCFGLQGLASHPGDYGTLS